MKKPVVVLIGILALVLTGFVIWQLTWMHNIVKNYDQDKVLNNQPQNVAQKGYVLQTPSDGREEVGRNQKNRNRVTAGRSMKDMEPASREQEIGRLTSDQSATNEQIDPVPAAINERGSKRDTADQNHRVIAFDRYEQEDTISIELKNDTPERGNNKDNFKTSSPDQHLPHLGSRSLIQHATSTSPY